MPPPHAGQNPVEMASPPVSRWPAVEHETSRSSPGGRWLRSALSALSSRRTLAVTLLSFSSGLPLGLVWYAIPDWLRKSGADIRIVGLITVAHAPWAF